MPRLLDLQRDRSFRWKLIGGCLAVTAFVASIYVVVSYRLAEDVGLQLELAALRDEAEDIHASLRALDAPDADALAAVVALHHPAEQADLAQWVQVRVGAVEWQLFHGLDGTQVATLQRRIEAQVEAGTRGGVLDAHAVRPYLWQSLQDGEIRVDMLEQASTFDTVLQYAAKRLTITSIIVFWVATWLAIVMTGWLARRVQDKRDQLAHLASHDTLTGLPNRLHLLETLQAALPGGEPRVPPLTRAGLFVIDLDKFKEVNDTFGHSAGDQLLVEMAQRLDNAVGTRRSVVRMGGDEFVIWAEDAGRETCTALAERLVAVCDAPVFLNGLAITTGASIGLALYPEHGDSADALLVCADAAMYQAKQNRLGWALYAQHARPEMSEQRLRLRADLTSAFEQQEFRLVYQPKVNLETGAIVGAEALARWHHPVDGVLTPLPFLELIERSGRIQQFGRYVLRAAIEQLHVWQGSGVHLPIAVNLSPYNLLDVGLLDHARELLARYCVEAGMLELELTESTTTQNVRSISRALQAFRDAGFRLAIDDFGTGMSSLAYISDLNVQLIKIDRSFIADLLTNAKHRAIVSTTITLGQSLGCGVVAEGIETHRQAELLRSMGCTYGQGFLFSPPVAAEQIAMLVRGGPLGEQTDPDTPWLRDMRV